MGPEFAIFDAVGARRRSIWRVCNRIRPCAILDRYEFDAFQTIAR